MGPLGPHYEAELLPKGATWAPWAPYGPELLPKGAAWAPWALMGRIWLQALQGNCSVPRRGVSFPPENDFFGFFVKKWSKKIEIEGVRLIWRDPHRNSASNPASDVQNGGMATHFKQNLCRFGSLGVPGPASTPLPCLLYTSPSPRDATLSRMPSSA